MAADAHVVLGAQKSGRDAIDDEKRRFREMARKLKLRRRGRTSALGDGLDDFTAGLTTAHMSSSDSEAASGAGLANLHSAKDCCVHEPTMMILLTTLSQLQQAVPTALETAATALMTPRMLMSRRCAMQQRTTAAWRHQRMAAC